MKQMSFSDPLQSSAASACFVHVILLFLCYCLCHFSPPCSTNHLRPGVACCEYQSLQQVHDDTWQYPRRRKTNYKTEATSLFKGSPVPRSLLAPVTVGGKTSSAQKRAPCDHQKWGKKSEIIQAPSWAASVTMNAAAHCCFAARR